jgi:hypothetical protein
MDDGDRVEDFLVVILFAVVGGIAVFFIAQLEFRSGDIGNYLAYADALTGNGPRDVVRYPPLVPALFAVAGFVTTELNAAQWVMASLYVAYVGGAYTWLRSITGTNHLAVPASFLVALGPGLAQLYGWFGASTLAGLAAMAWIGWALVQYRETPRVRTGATLVICIGALTWAHHFTSAIVGFALVVHTGLHLLLDDRSSARRLVAAGIGGFVASVPAWPFYYNLFSAYYTPGPAGHQNAFRVLRWFLSKLSRAGAIYVLLPFVGTTAGLYALYAAERPRYRSATYFSVSMGISAVAIFVYLPTNKSRALYYITLPLVVLLVSAYKESSLSISIPTSPERIALVACLLIAALQGPVWVSQTQSSVEYYQHINDGQINLIEDEIQSLPENRTVAVLSGPNPVYRGNNRYAWWIEGYGNREALEYGKRQYFIMKKEYREIFQTRELLVPGPRIESTHIRAVFAANQSDLHVWMQSENAGFIPAATVRSYWVRTTNETVTLETAPKHWVSVSNGTRSDVYRWPSRNITVRRTVSIADNGTQLTLTSPSPTVESFRIAGLAPYDRTYGLRTRNLTSSQVYITPRLYLHYRIDGGEILHQPNVWRAESTASHLSVSITNQYPTEKRLLGATEEAHYVNYCDVAAESGTDYAWVENESPTYEYLNESTNLDLVAQSGNTSLIRVCG